MGSPLFQRAKELFRKGQYRESEVLTQEYLDSCLPRSKDYALGLNFLCSIYFARGILREERVQAAIVEFDALAVELKDPFLIGLSQMRRGMLHFFDCQLNLSERMFQSAIQTLENMDQGDFYELAISYVNLGLVYRDLHDYPKAANCFLIGSEMAQRIGHAYTLKKALRELFYSYCYQKQYAEAHSAYQGFKEQVKSGVGQIEAKVLEAYLLMLRRRWKGARELLLIAETERRKFRVSKSRFEIFSHLSYYYAQKGEYKKAWLFYNEKSDPILRLNLMKHELENSKELEISQVKRYQTLNGPLEIPAHREIANHLLNYFRRNEVSVLKRKWQVKVDLLRYEVMNGKSKVASLGIHSPLRKLFFLMAQGEREFSKEKIIKEVFEFQFYESETHDNKVYGVVSQLNGLFPKAPFLELDQGIYRVNPKYIVFFFYSKPVPKKLLYKISIQKVLREKTNMNLRKISQEINAPLPLTSQLLAEMVVAKELKKVTDLYSLQE